MSDDLTDFWVHEVSIERYTGSTAYGDSYAAAAAATGLVDDQQRLVAGANGQTVTATATVFLPAAMADVPVKSRVTLPAVFGGRVGIVVAAARRDSGGLGLPDHVEVALQ